MARKEFRLDYPIARLLETESNATAKPTLGSTKTKRNNGTKHNREQLGRAAGGGQLVPGSAGASPHRRRHVGLMLEVRRRLGEVLVERLAPVPHHDVDDVLPVGAVAGLNTPVPVNHRGGTQNRPSKNATQETEINVKKTQKNTKLKTQHQNTSQNTK